jgi:FdhE protein
LPRILPRGEIESLEHTTIERVRLPERTAVFVDRANRLRHLATASPVGAYLQLMAHVADAQHRVLQGFNAPTASLKLIEQAQAHGMPPLQAAGWRRDPSWRMALRAILEHMATVAGAPAQAIEFCGTLNKQLDDDPASIERLADALLAERDSGIDTAAAPFVMAALQVYWADLASRFDIDQLPVVSPFGLCPCCGSLPVASIVRVGGRQDGCRYLYCSLCSTEWHLVRVTCSHCQETEGIAYHSVENGHEGIKAESCDACRNYRKIFYQNKDLYVDAMADDLASVALDILMGEEGYTRASGNPFLWQDAGG